MTDEDRKQLSTQGDWNEMPSASQKGAAGIRRRTFLLGSGVVAVAAAGTTVLGSAPAARAQGSDDELEHQFSHDIIIGKNGKVYRITPEELEAGHAIHGGSTDPSKQETVKQPNGDFYVVESRKYLNPETGQTYHLEPPNQPVSGHVLTFEFDLNADPTLRTIGQPEPGEDAPERVDHSALRKLLAAGLATAVVPPVLPPGLSDPAPDGESVDHRWFCYVLNIDSFNIQKTAFMSDETGQAEDWGDGIDN